MVEDTGKAIHADTIRPVDLPEPVNVEETPGGRPVAIKDKRRQDIAVIEDVWRIDDEWWRSEPLSRMYFAIITVSGRRMILFKDLMTGRWFRQKH